MYYPDEKFLNQLEQVSILNEELVSKWIDETVEIVKALLPDSSPFKGSELLFNLAFIDPESAPLGRWMGCYPEMKMDKAQLTVIPDWSFFLYQLYLSLQIDGMDVNVLKKALLDQSRLRIGITNDVFQPYAPLPEGYSMLRHHSLMLFLAVEWLPEESRKNWQEICSVAGRYMANYLSDFPNPLQVLTEVEDSAAQFMRETASASCTKAGLVKLMNISSVRETTQLYFAATCFGIDVLSKAFLKQARDNRDEWLKNEIENELIKPDYLNAEILSYLQGGYAVKV
ncbi:hypothetical protein [Halalkalibacter oceani]|uniref:hypothetical protein n=1 Tax=Halalkalibacter oceani TaxID=1653776 RepID=UPI003394E534